jgi:hypothetical protein
MRQQARFGVATGSFPVEDAAGKHLRFSGYIKTKDITEGFAGLWWRADGEGHAVAFDNMQSTGPRGTTDWKEYALELDIPEEIRNINFGVLHPGNGAAWFDSLKVELDGEEYVNSDRYDFGFEGGTRKGFPYGGGQGYRVEIDKEVAHSGKQSLRIEDVGEPEPEKKPEVDPESILQDYERVLTHMEASRESYLSKSAAKEYDWAVQNARVVLQSGRPMERDRAMADNVAWILDHAPAGTKIVLWAHNGHVMKRNPMMGSWLW